MKRGIYTIICSANNTAYIGQSINIPERFNQHRCKLRKGKHCNPYLQAAWDKYGEGSFFFRVHLLENDPGSCDRMEQKIIDGFRSDDIRLFNIRPAAATNKGVKFSRSTRDKISQKAKQQFQTDEARSLHSMAIRGDDRPCRLVSPDGETYEFRNPTAFGRSHGLTQSSILKLLRGSLHSYKGWTNPDVSLPPKKSCKLAPAQREEICVRYVAGERIADLSREFGIGSQSISNMIGRRGIRR